MTLINNYINGEFVDSLSNEKFFKYNPHNGQLAATVFESIEREVDLAVESATIAFNVWSKLTPVQRGDYLYKVVDILNSLSNDLASLISIETGKSKKDALMEINGAIGLGRFMASEGQRFYGKTTTSSQPNKYPAIIREPVGVSALIISYNTPIANIAWKVFPALICGNTVILKASEETPLTANFFASIINKANLPKGVFNVVYGSGATAGSFLVKNPKVDLISFTGSTNVGRKISESVSNRFVKTFLELGGKNPLVVCDDADLENAVKWSIQSAFSNAGQRCASGSRIIVFAEVYEKFKSLFVSKTLELKLGNNDTDDLGPVISERHFHNVMKCINIGVNNGANLLCGGIKSKRVGLESGWYIEPTIFEETNPDSYISQEEIFGPVTCLYKVSDLNEAIVLSNNSKYGLTACIHTNNIHRANYFTRNVQSGVAVINGGTFGSEPNMPFGGIKNSGNGLREPGTEALDVYSNFKNIITIIDPEKI